jgi:lipopolysaccharide export system protein LptA
MIQLKHRLQYGLLLTCFTLPLYALTADKEKIMHVLADTADLNQKKHMGTYTGHVALTQGTSNIRAHFAKTRGDMNNQLTLAIAKGHDGTQAHYWTQTDPNKPPFHAWADIIRYYPLRHFIELIGHAKVQQGDNSMQAAKISYDTIEQHVITHGDAHNRMNIIINPEQK